MSGNPFSQNNNDLSSTSYRLDSYEEKPKIVMILKVVVGIFIGIVILALVFHFFIPQGEDKNTQSATAAARKQNPNAQAKSVKVADGFAIATVSDPTSDGQSQAGNTTFFRINKDGSMTEIASGSYFSPIDLLGFGIPLTTQVKLLGLDLSQVQQTLASLCNYNGGDVPGFNGFNASFNPNGWQIDTSTLDNLEQALSDAIVTKNSGTDTSQQVICVNAVRDNSSSTVNTQTYISTFALDIQFITRVGILSTHKLNFSIGPQGYHTYTLDGQKVSANS